MSSLLIVWICSSPPPLRTSDSAESSSSISVLRVVRSSGMRVPGLICPVPPSGRSRLTNFSPSSDVWRRLARVSVGRTTSLSTSTVTSAV